MCIRDRDDIESKIQGLRGGADDYIVKPFEVLELLVRIEKVLERENKLSDVIKVLDLEIDISQRTVRKNGVEILLKPKEFELLRVLAKNKNIAISREKLLSMVWGYEYMGETRTVDVHIGPVSYTHLRSSCLRGHINASYYGYSSSVSGLLHYRCV